MPRANRTFLPGLVWHLTQRCHKQDYLLKFVRDRRRYRAWLFEARKRFGLCVLDYMVTSNHVHLLVKDTGNRTIARSLQLIAGRAAQEYNQRKKRQGAFWEDRYHATAIDSDAHLQRCLVYIDLNMVRAGVVQHPVEWDGSGYREIQSPPQRYAIIDLAELSALCGFTDVVRFQEVHRQWVADALLVRKTNRENCWSSAVAVGGQEFVGSVQAALGVGAQHRAGSRLDGVFVLEEACPAYRADFAGENGTLSAG